MTGESIVKYSENDYPLVNIQKKTVKNHHFQWGKSTMSMKSCSIAIMLVLPEGNLLGTP